MLSSLGGPWGARNAQQARKSAQSGFASSETIKLRRKVCCRGNITRCELGAKPPDALATASAILVVGSVGGIWLRVNRISALRQQIAEEKTSLQALRAEHLEGKVAKSDVNRVEERLEDLRRRCAIIHNNT